MPALSVRRRRCDRTRATMGESETRDGGTVARPRRNEGVRRDGVGRERAVATRRVPPSMADLSGTPEMLRFQMTWGHQGFRSA